MVGEGVEKFSLEFRHSRGIYITHRDIDCLDEILQNRTNPEIDLIVVSDGQSILGIGDQGIGGMLIPIAKLAVYSICGGINPLKTLPIILDVGTDNQALREDPYYLGISKPRIGQRYDNFIDKFVAARQEFSKSFFALGGFWSRKCTADSQA